MFSPIHKAFGFAIESEIPILSRVARLLVHRSPLHIAGLVVTVLIRKSIGSIPIFFATSSTTLSTANAAIGAEGAR